MLLSQDVENVNRVIGSAKMLRIIGDYFSVGFDGNPWERCINANAISGCFFGTSKADCVLSAWRTSLSTIKGLPVDLYDATYWE